MFEWLDMSSIDRLDTRLERIYMFHNTVYRQLILFKTKFYRINELVRASQDYQVIKSRSHLNKLKSDYEDHFEQLKVGKVDKVELHEADRQNAELKDKLHDMAAQLRDRDKKYNCYETIKLEKVFNFIIKLFKKYDEEFWLKFI